MKNNLKLLFSVLIITSSFIFAKIPTAAEMTAAQAVKNSFQPRQLFKVTYGRPDQLPNTYISQEGHFKLHYTTEGTDAVPTESTNPDNVPDWIYYAAQYAERAWFVLIDSIGFDVPPMDGVDGDEFDIYFVNLYGNYYANTYPENPVTETSRQYDYTAYQEIDNDFVESRYFTNGYDALKVTIAHEFFHVVHLGYGWNTNNHLTRMSQGDRFLLEWSSTWYEDFSYPEVNDYINYATSFSYSPDDNIWSSTYWYSHGIFMKFMIDNYGTDFLVKSFDKIKTGQRAFYALQEAIREETNTTLSILYNEYCQRMYFSGSKYDTHLSVSTDAQFFPNLRIDWVNRYEYSEFLEVSNAVTAFSTLPLVVSFSEAQHFGLLENKDFSGKFIGSYIFQDKAEKLLNQFNLNDDQYIAKSSAGDTLMLFITNKSEEVNENFTFTIDFVEPVNIMAINNLFPNPVDGNGNLTLNISSSETTEEIKVSVYNLLGQPVFRKIFPKNHNNLYHISLSNDISYSLASGIYILKVRADGKEKYIKFTILK